VQCLLLCVWISYCSILGAPVVSSVDFEWTYNNKKYQIVFDKEIDRLVTFIPEFIEDNQLEGVPEETIKEVW
jgi:hypothetical protein